MVLTRPYGLSDEDRYSFESYDYSQKSTRAPVSLGEALSMVLKTTSSNIKLQDGEVGFFKGRKGDRVDKL